MTATLDRRTLSEQIKDALLAQITTGALGPGDRLVELRIAQDMGTSQAPVREALRDLMAMGLVEMRRNRGAVIRGIDLAELQHIYAVRALLEGEATAQAAQVPGVLPEQLDRHCETMEQAVAAGDRTGFAALNAVFHRDIVAAADNPVLLEMWERLEVRAHTAVNLARPQRGLDGALQDHRAIVQLIKARDPEGARARMVQHIQEAVAEPETAPI